MPKLKLFLTALITFSFLITSCDRTPSVYKIEVKPDNLVYIAEQFRLDPKVSKENMDSYVRELNYLVTLKDSLKNKTVGDLINSGNVRQLNSSIESVVSTSNRIEIANSLGFYFDKFEFANENGQDINVAIYKLQNTSTKAIKAIKGYLDFYNGQGTLVKRYSIDISQEIPVGKLLSVKYPYGFDENNERDKLVRSDYTKFNRVWKPLMVEFKDGKKLQLLQM